MLNHLIKWNFIYIWYHRYVHNAGNYSKRNRLYRWINGIKYICVHNSSNFDKRSRTIHINIIQCDLVTPHGVMGLCQKLCFYCHASLKMLSVKCYGLNIFCFNLNVLPHWGRVKMGAILQTTHSKLFLKWKEGCLCSTSEIGSHFIPGYLFNCYHIILFQFASYVAFYLD